MLEAWHGLYATGDPVDEQTAWAKRVLGAADVDVDELRTVLDVVTRLTASLLATGSAASPAA